MKKLKMRTPEEMKAYVAGYNACNKQFRKCIKTSYTVMDAIKEMDMFITIVNGTLERETNK